LQHSLTIKSSVCMEAFRLSCKRSRRSRTSWDRLMFPTQVCFVICSGRTPRKTWKNGVRTIEASLLLLARRS
jgi:hypothetical protein